MRKKILYIFGYLLLATISLFSVIVNLTIILDTTVSPAPDKARLIVFTSIFGVIFLVAFFLFLIWLLRLFRDIRINKENK